MKQYRAADDGRYLVVLAVTVVLARAAEYLWPAARIAGVGPATAVTVAGGALTFVAWLSFRPRARWDRLTLAFLGLWLLAWAAAGWASIRHGDVLDLAVIVPPIIVGLVAARRPSGPAVTAAIDALAWATAALVWLVLVAQQTGLLDRASAGTSIPWDAMNYWVPLSEPLGFFGRWIGPFRTPNVTASAAVLLVVWGASRGWRSRIALIGTGALVLVLTGTRSSAFAAIAGVAVLVLLWPVRLRAFRVLRWLAGCAVAVVLVVGTMFWVERNPSLSGRMQIWPVYLDLWRSDPAGGVGDSGIGLAVEAGRLPQWATHAHSIYFDALARNGIIAQLAILALLAAAVAVTVRAARRGRPVGLALVVALLVGGLTETLFDWRYLGFQVTVLLGAVLVAAAYHRGPGQARATQLTGRQRRRSRPADLRSADACVALDAAYAGAQVVRARFGTPLSVATKAGADITTDVDVAAERAVREVLAHERPDDVVVGEELGGAVATTGRTWLVDPLCGTANFATGLPLAATNVALLVDGQPTVAAVADPFHEQIYWTDGVVARRWPLPTGPDVDLVPDAGGGTIAVDASMPAERTAVLLSALSSTAHLRPVMLATSLATAWVAAGRLAGYVEAAGRLDSVHFAAGIAIARAAGCVVTDVTGAPLTADSIGLVVAADRATHEALIAALAS